MVLTEMSRAFRLLIVLTAVSLVVACGGPQARYASHLQRGKQYLEQGDLDKARVELRSALQIQPKAAEALYLSGTVEERRGSPRSAAGQYRAAIDIRPDFPEAAAGLGRVYLLGGAPAQAAAVVAPLLAKHPEDSELLVVRGASRFALGDKAGALADAQQAVAHAPGSENALENAVELLAGLYRDAGESGRAIGAVTDALQRLPSSAKLREVLAQLYMATGETAKAEQALRALVALRPEELRYTALLAQFYAGQHRTDDAQSVLQDAVRARPADDRIKVALADFVARQRSPQQGEALLRTFAERQPADQDLKLALGSLLRRDGALPEAVATYRQVIEANGVGAQGLIARDQIAAIELSRGNANGAAGMVDEVLKVNPRDADALSVRADIEQAHGNAAAAINDLRAILRDAPNSVAILRRLAGAYASNGQADLEEETLRSAVDLAPQDSAARNTLSELLLERNRPEQVVTINEHVLASEPNDAAALAFLVRAHLAEQDFGKAAAAARELNTRHPELASGPYLAGVIAAAQSQTDAARGDFERALRIEPRAADALSALIDLETRSGRSGEALVRLRAIVAADPDNAVAQQLYGRVLAGDKAYAEAIAHLTRATQLAPNWLPSYVDLVAAETAAADIPRATAACEAGLRQFPWNPVLAIDLTSLYERQGRTNEAIAEAQALHSHRPDVPLAARSLALLLVTYRTDAASLAQARELVRTFGSSTDPSQLDALGWVRVKSGDASGALEPLRRAVQQSPGSAAFHYHLGIAQWKLGQLDDARTSLEAALAPPARFAGIAEARAALASINASRS